MRFVLCLLLAAIVLPGSAAAKRTLTLAQAQAAAARGDNEAARALTTTVDRQVCLSECANRGHDNGQCSTACRPGLCHPDADQPYCIAR